MLTEVSETKKDRADPPKPLNDRTVKNAKAEDVGYWLTDYAPGRRVGRLVLRVLPSGTKRWYYRYTDSTGKRVHQPIGDYTADGRGMTLAQARNRVADLQALHRNPESHDVREHLAEQELKEAQRRKEEAEARTDLERHTLKALSDEYVKHLKKAGKYSAGDAENVIGLHAKTLAHVPAAHITARQITELVRSLAEAGKKRTAGKLRSYLHAAYALAVRAENDPAAPSVLVSFGIHANPVAPVAAKSTASQARDRCLSEKELQAYMLRIQKLPEMTRSPLWLALLLGGQRPAQVLRLKVSDVDLTANTVKMYDPKGKRTQPRPHILPLTAEALLLLQPILEARAKLEVTGPWVFSNNHGKTPVRLETLSAAVRDIEKEMRKAKEIGEHFQMRDVRRTCETMLASMGISKDARAQILSHGIGGVQDKHYDRYTYIPEKIKALQSWAKRLQEIVEMTEAPSNVVPINRKVS